MKHWRALLVIIAIACFTVALYYPISYRLSENSNNSELEELSDMRRRVRDELDIGEPDGAPVDAGAQTETAEALGGETQTETAEAPGGEAPQAAVPEATQAPGDDQPAPGGENLTWLQPPEDATESTAQSGGEVQEAQPLQETQTPQEAPAEVPASQAQTGESALPWGDMPTLEPDLPEAGPTRAPAAPGATPSPWQLVDGVEVYFGPSFSLAPGQTPDPLLLILEAVPGSTPTPTPTPRPTPTQMFGPTLTPSPTPDRNARTGALAFTSKEKVALDESLILPELREIYELNHDLVGWIFVDGTIIDYPVVQTEDSEFYLNHDFYGNHNNNGQIILDPKCDPYTPSYNLVISGHHMNNGSMFGGLPRYRDKSYWAERKIVEFDTLMERKRYVIFAVFYSADYDVNEKGFRYNADVQYRLEAEKWLAEIEANQLYDTGIDAEYGDEFITLTTCDRSRRRDGRFVAVGRRIRKGEEIE